ncbi:MAG: recombinase family protein [Solirubrobacteraceae bacterium]
MTTRAARRRAAQTRRGSACASRWRHAEDHPTGPPRPAGRSLGAELRDRDVGLHVIEQGIDTTTAEGRAMFGMLSVLAELHCELIVASTRDGLAAARLRGRKGGRRPRLNPEQAIVAQQLYDAGERTVQQIADLFSVPRTTVYGHLDAATKGKRPAGQTTAVSR